MFQNLICVFEGLHPHCHVPIIDEGYKTFGSSKGLSCEGPTNVSVYKIEDFFYFPFVHFWKKKSQLFPFRTYFRSETLCFKKLGYS